MKYHMIAFLGGFVLDLLCGDPYWLPHPVRWIGRAIEGLENKMIGKKGQENKELTAKEKRRRGTCLVVLMLLSVWMITSLLLLGAYLLHPALGVALEMLMTYQILALKCLRVESMKVYHCLKTGTLEQARMAVSMIVGRDTAVLDETGVTKAAIETVAENTSDGVIAPLLYTALGGPVLGFFYKTVNTMDSMIAYKNDRYLEFGRTAAKLDDVCNYLPSRISAYLMMIACVFSGKDYDAKEAYRIYKRDRRKHASPNSAQTEATCAGALGIQLAGNAYYFGRLVEKPYIGDAKRPVETEDIKRANRLLYGTAFLCVLVLTLMMSFML